MAHRARSRRACRRAPAPPRGENHQGTPGEPVVRRSVHRPQRHRTAASAVAGALALALGVTVLAGLPNAANAATGTAAINVAAATSQCAMGLGRPQKGSAAKATALMAGHADLGVYGS